MSGGDLYVLKDILSGTRIGLSSPYAAKDPRLISNASWQQEDFYE
jgi:hypothetical protein